MEKVRQRQKKLTKDKKKKSKFLGLFLVFRECTAIKIRHKRYDFCQRYFDCWIGKFSNKKVPLWLGFSQVYLEKAFENHTENEKLPYELLSIRIDETVIEFSFIKSSEKAMIPKLRKEKSSVVKMPRFKYEDGKHEN